MSEIILEAQDVYFSYDNDKTHSLHGFSVKIEKGKKIAVMGANGSGKSTFFLCCNGIHKPKSGKILYKGQPVEYSRKGLLALRSKVGIVFQDPDNQLFSASVYQEISFGILNLGVKENDAKQKVEEVIDFLEITPFRQKPTHALSGGQKKQVSIADILVMNPEVIILDEPDAALDPRHSKIVNKMIHKLTDSGMTVMMSTHNVDQALEWADEVILVHEGQVLKTGTPMDVFSDKKALEITNLEQPAVMQVFKRLCQKGILQYDLEIPRTILELELYLADIKICR